MDSLTMQIDEFNEELYPFCAEFGYCASGSLPNNVRETFDQNLSPEPGANPDKAMAIALEHSSPEYYFVRLFWHSSRVGDFVCSVEQYNQEIIPQAVIEAARTY